MYISNKNRDYNSLEYDYILATDDHYYVGVNFEGKYTLCQIEATCEVIKFNEDKGFESTIRNGKILGNLHFTESYFFSGNNIYWHEEAFMIYDINTEEKAKIVPKEELNLKPGSKNFTVYDGNIIALDTNNRLVMIGPDGEILWSFLNNNFMVDEKGGKYYGSDTFNNAFFEYNGYLYVTSNMGGKIIRIKIGGTNDDWDYLGIDSVSFCIINNLLIACNIHDVLSVYNLDVEAGKTCKPTASLEGSFAGMFSIGNRVLSIMQGEGEEKLVLINPNTLKVQVLANNAPYILDIATNKNDVFIKCRDDVYKIPREVLKSGGFDMKQYCYFDSETTKIEDEFEF